MFWATLAGLDLWGHLLYLLGAGPHLGSRPEGLCQLVGQPQKRVSAGPAEPGPPPTPEAAGEVSGQCCCCPWGQAGPAAFCSGLLGSGRPWRGPSQRRASEELLISKRNPADLVSGPSGFRGKPLMTVGIPGVQSIKWSAGGQVPSWPRWGSAQKHVCPFVPLVCSEGPAPRVAPAQGAPQPGWRGVRAAAPA